MRKKKDFRPNTMKDLEEIYWGAPLKVDSKLRNKKK